MSRQLRECTCTRCGSTFRATIKDARFCPACRWLDRTGRSRPQKYPLTEAAVELIRAEYDSTPETVGRLAARLRWPKWKVRRVAAELAVTRPQRRQPWTDEEDALLSEEAGRRTVGWLSRRLKRTPSSVANRLKRLRISQSVSREWYTAQDLALCMGVDPTTVLRWVRSELLHARQSGPRQMLRITDADVRRFVRENPMRFDIRKVDQLWFVDLLAGVAVVRDEKRDEEVA